MCISSLEKNTGSDGEAEHRWKRQIERKEDLEILKSPLAEKARRDQVKTSMRGW